MNVNTAGIVIASLWITALIAAGSYVSSLILGIERWQAAVSGIILMVFVLGGIFLIGRMGKAQGRKPAGKK